MFIRAQLRTLKRDVQKLAFRKNWQGLEEDYYLEGMEPKGRLLLLNDEPAPPEPIL